MKRLLSYVKPYNLFLFWTLVIKTSSVFFDFAIPYLLGMIIDEVAPRTSPDNLSPIFFWGGVMLLCALITFFANVYANKRSALFAKNVVQHLRKDSFDKILSLSSRQTDQITVPSLVSRMSSDTYAIHHMITTALRPGIRAPLLLLGGIIVTLSISPALSTVFLILLPLLALFTTLISRKGVRLFKLKQKKVDRMVEKVRDSFTGIRVIKALSKTEHEKKDFAHISDDLSRSEWIANITMGSSRPLVSIFLNLGMTAVIALGAFLVVDGNATPGQIISFMTYFTMILNATITVTRIFTIVSRGMASLDRISEVLDLPADLTVMEIPQEENAPFLEFRNVTFTYQNKKTPALENVSFTLEKGQALGIIGSTGCGKTTLLRLLLRFYDPQEGQILWNGRDLRSIPPKELRSLFGIVFQNDFLQQTSLKENVRFSRDISDEAVIEALHDSQAWDFISSLEDGVEHPIASKGYNLSGGQRQRVLIARALAEKKAFLILDDSSSALDYKTDAALREALKKRDNDGVRIVVAQRISSVKNSDLILVLEHGKIVGQGKDEDLKKTCPIYQEIAHSQMGEMTL